MVWYTIQCRDFSLKKYRVEVFKPQNTNDSWIINFSIENYKTQIASGSIEFTRTWLMGQDHYSDFNERLGVPNQSPLISGILRDWLWGKSIDELKRSNSIELRVHHLSKYVDGISLNNDNFYIYKRDIVVVANENRFARDIVLREFYELYSLRGETEEASLTHQCHYYDNAIHNAIQALESGGLIKRVKPSNLLIMTHEGQVICEDKVLTPFNDKIFLIAACSDEIDKLITKVYDPAVRSLGYTLKFQERSEPKNSIHDDIWDYIKYCKVILCDLTHQRPNCFIEYGYALGIKKAIILCVEEGEGKDENGMMAMPFDTLTQKYSFWQRDWLKEGNEKVLSDFKNQIAERVKMKIAITDIDRTV